jgi:hypothetical protein
VALAELQGAHDNLVRVVVEERRVSLFAVPTLFRHDQHGPDGVQRRRTTHLDLVHLPRERVAVLRRVRGASGPAGALTS